MAIVGIATLKQIIDVGLQLGQSAAAALADKKLTASEIFGFLPSLMQIPAIVQAGDQIKAEFKDLDPVERKELVDYFSGKFSLTNVKAEAVIEHALVNAISLIALVEEFKALKKPATP